MAYQFFTGNLPISIAIAVLIGLAIMSRRSLISQMTKWDTSGWNLLGVVGLISTLAAFLWISFIDNWRQLLGYWMESDRRYQSDPMEAALVSDPVRWVTFALLGLSVVAMALLFARHHGPMPVLVLALIFAPIYAFTMNAIRARADVFLRLTDTSFQNPSAFDLSFVIFWSTGLFFMIATIILATYFFFLALVGIPVRIIYSLFHREDSGQQARTYDTYQRRSRAMLAGTRKPGGQAPGI